MRFGDLCFPIVDHQFRLYEFPFLFDNEDPMSTLAKYVRMTKIGFTTSDDFKEVPFAWLLSTAGRSKNQDCYKRCEASLVKGSGQVAA